MKVLHLLASGGIGGIETLMKNYAECSQNENVFLFAYSGGVIADQISAMNNEVIHVPKEIRGSVRRLEWILTCCRNLQPDVIVSHHSSPIFKLALAWCRAFMTKTKTVAYAHANALDIYGARYKGAALRKWIHRIGFMSADGIVAISGSVKESLIKSFGIRREKVFVLHNAIRIPQDTPPIRAFGEKLELIYVGRLIKEKGVQTIIKSLSYYKLGNMVHLTIVGDGAYRKYLEELSVKLGVDQAIDFAGLQNDIRPFLCKADVFVHSPEWEEGFGITVVEAMAYGLLCICANSGALPELIRHGKSGFLVEAHSDQALAEMLVWVKENAECEESFRAIRENAQNDAKQFDRTAYTRKLDAFLMKG